MVLSFVLLILKLAVASSSSSPQSSSVFCRLLAFVKTKRTLISPSMLSLELFKMDDQDFRNKTSVIQKHGKVVLILLMHPTSSL